MSCDDTLLNVVFSDVPIEFTAATITIEIPAAIRAYSMEVAPVSSCAKRPRTFLIAPPSFSWDPNLAVLAFERVNSMDESRGQQNNDSHRRPTSAEIGCDWPRLVHKISNRHHRRTVQAARPRNIASRSLIGTMKSMHPCLVVAEYDHSKSVSRRADLSLRATAA